MGEENVDRGAYFWDDSNLALPLLGLCMGDENVDRVADSGMIEIWP